VSFDKGGLCVDGEREEGDAASLGVKHPHSSRVRACPLKDYALDLPREGSVPLDLPPESRARAESCVRDEIPSRGAPRRDGRRTGAKRGNEHSSLRAAEADVCRIPSVLSRLVR
jgi:hypothetical protein